MMGFRKKSIKEPRMEFLKISLKESQEKALKIHERMDNEGIPGRNTNNNSIEIPEAKLLQNPLNNVGVISERISKRDPLNFLQEFLKKNLKEISKGIAR